MNAVKHPLLGDTLYTCTHPSGLPIVVWPQPQASSVYAVFATRYGSVHNTLPTADGGSEEVPAGIAHYLEHKLFESENGDAFTRYAKTGASANAYTTFDQLIWPSIGYELWKRASDGLTLSMLKSRPPSPRQVQ